MRPPSKRPRKSNNWLKLLHRKEQAQDTQSREGCKRSRKDRKKICRAWKRWTNPSLKRDHARKALNIPKSRQPSGHQVATLRLKCEGISLTADSLWLPPAIWDKWTQISITWLRQNLKKWKVKEKRDPADRPRNIRSSAASIAILSLQNRRADRLMEVDMPDWKLIHYQVTIWGQLVLKEARRLTCRGSVRLTSKQVHSAIL